MASNKVSDLDPMLPQRVPATPSRELLARAQEVQGRAFLVGQGTPEGAALGREADALLAASSAAKAAEDRGAAPGA